MILPSESTGIGDGQPLNGSKGVFSSEDDLKLRRTYLKYSEEVNQGVGQPWPQGGDSITGKPSGKISSTEYNPIGERLRKFDQYVWTDWRGQKLLTLKGVGDTKSKFDVSTDLPKNPNTIFESPHSIRDHYLLSNETSLDFFKHDLQVADGINALKGPEFWSTQLSPKSNPGANPNTNLGDFKYTPVEHNDPVMFGFDIIFDDISSPLLNGSINDFLEIFSPNISEIAARKPIYEEFKQQFIKFFRTRATVRTTGGPMTSGRPSLMATEGSSKQLFSGGKAYLNYYLKKVGGLSLLVEGNTSATKKFLVDYNKDVITLGFTEDVSLSVGVLAHLYKLLYFSKPNGKTMIPENLLRFNCDIIISEVRNYNRVRRSIESGDIQIITDNVSRYVYSLKECQLYFNTMPHDDIVDLGAIKTFDTYDITFDYKYSTVKLDKFVIQPIGGSVGGVDFGKYISYNNGAIWKVGNAGSREAAGTQSALYGKSTPAFFTAGQNTFNQNGVITPAITAVARQIKILSPELPAEPTVATPASPTASTGSTIIQQLSDIENRRLGISKEIFDTIFLKGIKFTPAAAKFNRKTMAEEEEKAVKEESLKSPKDPLALYNPAPGFNPQTTEEALREQAKKTNAGQRLASTFRNSINKELQTAVNTRVAILNKSLNKILNSVGITGVSPPRNVYKGNQLGAVGRIFNDIRGQLIEFLGGK